MGQFLKYHGLTILWALFIFIMCSISMGSVGKSTLFFPGFDKLVHCGFFFVLIVLYANGWIRQQNVSILLYKYMAIMLFTALLYGGIIEILQLYVFTWRSGEWDDLFADAVGASMGIFSIWVTQNAIKDVKK